MIKAHIVVGGRPVLVLGLSDENVSRLTDNQPIHIGAHEVAGLGFPPVEIVILHGVTEAEIVDDLRALGLPGTPPEPGR